MPLSEPAARRHRHTRRIDLAGYEREDGLWDVEAHLVDTKGYEFDNRFRGPIEAGVPVHEMWMRLTLDDSLTIRAVEAVTDHSPFPDCPVGAEAYQQLVGMRVRSGWTDEVKRRIGSSAGCTHLFELLRPLATTAIQTIMPLRKKTEIPDPERQPPLIGSCHGWRPGSEAVREYYPRWYRKE